ncbi:MAG TPA: transglutaminase N-terminal domain-containing protein [Acidimicrobiales bacterium]|nr:transglutaminase N-terminal domain-containing protein [Acidimicrobiales bacterium]
MRYSHDGPVTDLHQRLVVVPRRVHGSQRRRHWALWVDGVSTVRRRARHDSFGNLVLDLVVPRVDGWVEFNIAAEVSMRSINRAPRCRPNEPSGGW